MKKAVVQQIGLVLFVCIFKTLLGALALLLGAWTLLRAPGRTTRSKKLLGACIFMFSVGTLENRDYSRLPKTATGEVRLAELRPCCSCIAVLRQMQLRFPGPQPQFLLAVTIVYIAQKGMSHM